MADLNHTEPQSIPFPRRLLNSVTLALALARQRRAAWRPASARRNDRDRRARAIIRYAASHVPFYREALQHLGASPRDFRTVEDLRRLPFIHPHDVHLNLEHFTAQGVDRSHWLQFFSSGTTGTGRFVYADGPGLLANSAHGARDRAIVPGPVAPASGFRELCIGAPYSTNAEIQRFVARHTLAPAAMRPQRRYLDMGTDPAEAVSTLLEFEPHALLAYGSYIADIAAVLRRNGPRSLPCGFIVTSEAISSEARRFLVEECGARLISIYGAVEALKIGFSCDQWSGIHLNDDLYPLRVVDPDGQDLPTGEPGEVVVSNLINRATVLLNYRLHDVARLLPEPCPCGRALPLLSFPEGRLCDWVKLPGGGRIHSMAAMMAIQTMPGILQFQVTQRAVEDFEILVVPNHRRPWPEIEAELVVNFRRQFGANSRVAVHRVESIARAANGKRRLWIVPASSDSV